MEGSFVIQDSRTFSSGRTSWAGRMFTEYPGHGARRLQRHGSARGRKPRKKPLMKRMMPIVKQRGLFKLAGEVRKAVKSL